MAKYKSDNIPSVTCNFQNTWNIKHVLICRWEEENDGICGSLAIFESCQLQKIATIGISSIESLNKNKFKKLNLIVLIEIFTEIPPPQEKKPIFYF